MTPLTAVDAGRPYLSHLIQHPWSVIRNDGPAEAESFRLAPIASTNVPQYELHNVQEPTNVQVGEGLLKISKLVINLEKAVSGYGAQDVPEHVDSPGASRELALVKTPQKANMKQQSVKAARPRHTTPSFTFVSMTTSDGKRDWTAEAQIRSHAAKRVQAKKKNERQRNAGGLPASDPKIDTHVKALTPARDLHGAVTVPKLEESQNVLDTRLRDQIRSDDDTRSSCSPTPSCGSKVFGHLRCGECDGMAVFHEYNGAVDVHYVSGAVPNPFGQSLFDPFGQMAEPITHRMHELLSHWVFFHSPQVVPRIYGRNNISKLGVEHELKDAMEDDVACHVISAAAGFQQAELILKNDTSLDSAHVSRSRLRHEEALNHLQQGMQKLNLRFKTHTQTLTPSTIMNVARLALATAFAGDTRAHKAHHDGFVKLIEFRGGIDTIPRDKAHHISRIESNSAWTDKVTPRLPQYRSEARLLNPNMGSPFPNRELQDFLWEPLFGAAVDLAHMSYLVDERLASGTDNPLSKEKAEWNEDTFAATQHKLVSFPHPEQQMVKSVMYFRQNCWRCAAFIYFNTVLRMSPGAGIIRFAIDRLIDSLQQSEPWTGWAPHSNVLLWVVLMGMVGSSSAAEKGLFQIEFRRLLRQLQLSTAEEMRDVLRKQVWRDVPLLEHLKRLV